MNKKLFSGLLAAGMVLNPMMTLAASAQTITTTASTTGTWIQSSNGKWWYKLSDGSYFKDCWAQINGKWYHFDASGWMQTGWITDGEYKYYLEPDGQMATNKWIGNYYVDSSGHYIQKRTKTGADATGVSSLSSVAAISTNKVATANTTSSTNVTKSLSGTLYAYKSAASSAKASTASTTGSGTGSSISTSSSSSKKTGWVKNSAGKWQYYLSDGSLKTSGWLKVNGKWYFFKDSIMQTGWVISGGKYYYLYSDGSMAYNTWIGKYHVNSNGVWDQTK